MRVAACLLAISSLGVLPAWAADAPASTAAPSPAAVAADKPDNDTCLACHGNAGFSAPGAGGKERPLHVAQDKFGASSHGKLECVSCHTAITDVPHKNIPAEGSPARAAQRKTIPDLCGTCHAKQRDEYATSVHGRETLQKGNPAAAVCSDCHKPHAVQDPTGDVARLTITKSCGSCHKDMLRTYTETYHGQINALGYANTAKCFDCHGSHGIQRVGDPASSVHRKNRLETCQKCHINASEGFATFAPHGDARDFARYPMIWLAQKMMVGLLVGTFAFFWLHTAMWFYREYKERSERKSRPQVMASALPPGTTGKHFQRFSATWRVAHLTFALSLMVLTLTGMPVFYPESSWAPAVMKLLGGPQTAAIIHRVAAVVFAGVFFWHLAYVGLRLARNWKNFRIFGSDSLIPGLQDLKDIVAMFTWFIGKGPRPIFDRWTYWEKFDYWAPFWGVTIIGVSGLMMWLPNLTASFLPGWVFNIAAIFHGEEAFLAVVFLFTVHFFNNHFRPDKFPLDVVMFTGTMTLEAFRHEHGVQYQRLLDSGELEKHLVDAPSQPMTLGAKILGTVLIIVGLTLLVFVLAGFLQGFSGGH